MTSAALPRAEPPALPYSPLMQRLIRPLQHGFLVLNRWFMAPALRAGLGRLIGNPLTGHLMLLRTRGRRSGLRREAPLGYEILDGAVYCVAGYGAATPWLLNLEADPTVEVVLPTRRLHGRATIVSDDAEWLRAYRALIASFGLVGRIVDGDPARLDDATVLAAHRALPVVRIVPVEGAPRWSRARGTRAATAGWSRTSSRWASRPARSPPGDSFAAARRFLRRGQRRRS